MAVIGNMVFYAITSQEAQLIQAQRAVYKENQPPHGVVIHVGADVAAGMSYPTTVTAVHDDGAINGQVMLDGNDHLWVRHVKEGAAEGQWQTTYTSIEPPPEPPSEMGVLNIDMNDSDNTTVALEDKVTTASVGTILKIDAEYMTIIDLSDPNNLIVARPTTGSTIAPHHAGAQVGIYGAEAPPVVQAHKTKKRY